MASTSSCKWGWHSHLLVLLSAHTPHPQCKDCRSAPPCDWLGMNPERPEWCQELGQPSHSPARSSFQEQRMCRRLSHSSCGYSSGGQCHRCHHSWPQAWGSRTGRVGNKELSWLKMLTQLAKSKPGTRKEAQSQLWGWWSLRGCPVLSA